MAFNQDQFSTVGAHSADSPKIYSYKSSDTLATVLAAGYFAKKNLQLEENDWILAVLSDASALLQVSSDTSTVALSSITASNPAYAEYHLTTTPEVLALNNDGVTYTVIPNMVLNIGKEFTVAAGIMTYNGINSRFLINGTSDLEVNKAADVTFALVINGVPVPTELTTVSFSSAGKKRNISITAIADINQTDTIEIWAKGDGTMSVSLTVNKLDTTYLRIDNA